jgi:hypothetical protein
MEEDGESLCERQEFEVEALKAIYDNDFEVNICQANYADGVLIYIESSFQMAHSR